MTGIDEVLADLAAESAELDAAVAGLAPADWARDTPAAGWTIAHQIAHLAWTDSVALTAATDADAFWARLAASPDLLSEVDRGAAEGAADLPADLLAHWRSGRDQLAAALAHVPPGGKIPWFGPPMSAMSMATARLMETWAHGLDVFDALGLAKPPTARERHIAYLGVRTRAFAYSVRGLPPPADDVRVELTGPDGDLWAFGPPDAAQRVTGLGHDFVLLATRRRHRDDLSLKAEGADADHWLTIVQAFAGPPGDDPQPRGH